MGFFFLLKLPCRIKLIEHFGLRIQIQDVKLGKIHPFLTSNRILEVFCASAESPSLVFAIRIFLFIVDLCYQCVIFPGILQI